MEVPVRHKAGVGTAAQKRAGPGAVTIGLMHCKATLLSALLAATTAEASTAWPRSQALIDQVVAEVTDREAWRTQAHWRLATAPVSVHFRYSEEHRRVWAVALERQRLDGWLLGGSHFSNSFGQPSAYLYLGRRFETPFGLPEGFFGQVSAGLMYGYRGKFQDKVPMNVNGFSPGALVSMGWQFERRASAAIHLLGDAGLMLQLSWDLR